jgi:LPS-assembly protein
VEGFWGTEAFARLDGRFYQGLYDIDDTGRIPTVLPLAYGEYVFPRDGLGGTASVDAQAFSITRTPAPTRAASPRAPPTSCP